MDKLKSIAKKTGLHESEINKFSKLGFLGFAALLLAGLVGCFKNGVDKPVQQEKPAEQKADIIGLQDLANDLAVERSTYVPNAVKPALNQKSDNCGPYPGYPCGTRYYTVSLSDFNSLV